MKKILVVEDDINVCNQFQNIIENDPNLELIGITNNSKEAVSLIKDFLPNAVILDLELHSGGGNGIEVLREVSELFLPLTPFFVVTTNNNSKVTYEAIRNLGADFIMYKNEDGYSEKKVIDFLNTIFNSVLKAKKTNLTIDVSTEAKTKNLINRVQYHFNLIGISPKALGYAYLTDAVIMVFNGETHNLCNKIAKNYKKSESSVERAIQNAINKAWNSSDIDSLLTHYTCKINSNKGVPTMTEFIHYYANKLKNEY